MEKKITVSLKAIKPKHAKAEPFIAKDAAESVWLLFAENMRSIHESR